MKVTFEGRFSANDENFNKKYEVRVEEDNSDPTPFYSIYQGDDEICLDEHGLHEMVRALKFFDRE